MLALLGQHFHLCLDRCCCLQYAARLAALSSDIDNTCAALHQLDADMTEHANFLATYHDQAS